MQPSFLLVMDYIVEESYDFIVNDNGIEETALLKVADDENGTNSSEITVKELSENYSGKYLKGFEFSEQKECYNLISEITHCGQEDTFAVVTKFGTQFVATPIQCVVCGHGNDSVIIEPVSKQLKYFEIGDALVAENVKNTPTMPADGITCIKYNGMVDVYKVTLDAGSTHTFFVNGILLTDVVSE